MIKLSKVIRYPRHAGRKPGRKLLTVIIVFGICITLYLYLGQAYEYWQAKSELNKMHAHLEELREKNMELEEEIILLQEEEYLELRARTELGLVRPGEIIFSVGD